MGGRGGRGWVVESGMGLVVAGDGSRRWRFVFVLGQLFSAHKVGGKVSACIREGDERRVRQPAPAERKSKEETSRRWARRVAAVKDTIPANHASCTTRAGGVSTVPEARDA